MLFSTLYIGSQTNYGNGHEATDSSNGIANPSYFTKAGQALVTGRYDKARPYSVEAVLLYAICNYRRKEDRDTETWMLMGLGARLAMRMGYHRDRRCSRALDCLSCAITSVLELFYGRTYPSKMGLDSNYSLEKDIADYRSIISSSSCQHLSF